MGAAFCKNVENGGCFLVKQWKMGVFCKNVENRGCFVKKVDLFSPQDALCTVSVFFLFYILLIWGAYAPNAPPAYGPVRRRRHILFHVSNQCYCLTIACQNASQRFSY